MPDQENENPDVQPPVGEPAAESTAAAPTPEQAGLTSGLPPAPPVAPQEAHFSEQAAKQEKRGPKRFLRQIIGVGIAIAIGIGITYFNGKKESDNAPAVGECAKSVGENEIEKISCSDPDADFEVVSRVDDTTDGQTACAGNPTVTSFYAYEAKNTGVGVEFVLCLADH
jgi:hypothetical protein